MCIKCVLPSVCSECMRDCVCSGVFRGWGVFMRAFGKELIFFMIPCYVCEVNWEAVVFSWGMGVLEVGASLVYFYFS